MKKPRTPRAGQKPAAASDRTPTYDDLLAIARLVESGSRFTEFRLRSGDIEVEVKRANGMVRLDPGPRDDTGVAPVAAASARAPPPDLPAGTHLIKSPMVGTFYRAPEPGAKPFVEPGKKVKPDTIVCI